MDKNQFTTNVLNTLSEKTKDLIEKTQSEFVYEAKDTAKKQEGILKTIIKSVSDNDDADSKSIGDMAKDLLKDLEANGGLSPKQSEWIFNTSQAMFKK